MVFNSRRETFTDCLRSNVIARSEATKQSRSKCSSDGPCHTRPRLLRRSAPRNDTNALDRISFIQTRVGRRPVATRNDQRVAPLLAMTKRGASLLPVQGAFHPNNATSPRAPSGNRRQFGTSDVATAQAAGQDLTDRAEAGDGDLCGPTGLAPTLETLILLVALQHCIVHPAIIERTP